MDSTEKAYLFLHLPSEMLLSQVQAYHKMRELFLFPSDYFYAKTYTVLLPAQLTNTLRIFLLCQITTLQFESRRATTSPW